MEKRVNISDYMEGQAGDIVAIQQFTQDRDDHIVADGIDPGLKYHGFLVTKSAATQIQIATGRLYSLGKAFAREAVVTKEVLAYVPAVTKRILAVVAWGTLENTNAVTRSFMIDAQSEQTEPRSVNLHQVRFANIDVVAGQENASPIAPVVDANQCVIAWVNMTTAGVESIVMNEDARLTSVADLDARVGGLESWRGLAGTKLNTISTDITTIKKQLTLQGGSASKMIEAMAFDVARMRETLNLPAAYNNYGAEFFLTPTDSDTARAGFDCRLEEGLTFPDAAADVRAMTLFNAFDANVVQYPTGLVLPAHTNDPRIASSGYSGEVSLTQYNVGARTLQRLSMARFRVRYGRRYVTVRGEVNMTALAEQLAAVPVIFRRELAGEAENVFTTDLRDDGALLRSKYYKWYLVDFWGRPYWRYVRSNIAVQGAIRAQTFLNSQAGWLTQIGLFFTRKAASGDVRVLITKVADSGIPDMTAVVSETTLALADIVADTKAKKESLVTLTPTFLEAGERYAIVLITQGAHWVALATTASYNAGTFFTSTDGSYFDGNEVQDLRFTAYFAKFPKTFLTTTLAALSLSGGIANIDLLADAFVPQGANLSFEVKAAGGAWTPLAQFDKNNVAGPLTSLPPLLEFRALFSGTTELMPAIHLAGAQQYLSRAKTAFTWMSKPIALSAASATIKVKVLLSEFAEVNHDCTITLENRTAAVGTWVAPGVTQDKTLPGGMIERTCSWVLGSAASAIAIKIVGATADALSMWSVEEMSWVAQT